jgi:hypothetical protein
MKMAIQAEDSAPKKLCYAKEATVFAIAPVTPMAPTNMYHAIPIMVSGSCKHESIKDFYDVVQTVKRAWNKHHDGGLKYGKIISLASNGDSISRGVRNMICSAANVKDIDAWLYLQLYNLPGFDLKISVDGKTHTCDPKHLWKRFCTQLWNEDGIVVFNVVVTPDDFQTALTELGLSDTEAAELFNYKDKQNVPKAA